MNEQETLKKLEDLLVKAIQSGKRETSGLVGDIRKEIAVINEILKEQNKTLFRIEDQTTKHNGRMRSLELWRSYIIGGLSVIGVVITLLCYIWINTVSHIEAKTEQLEAKLEKL